MNRHALIILPFIIACHSSCRSEFQTKTQNATQAVSAGCPSLVPNDGQDDTALLQQAIDNRCCLDPGIYDVITPTPIPGQRRRYDMLKITPSGQLCGSNAESTIIVFHGDAGNQDWRGVEMTGSSISDITLRTDSAMINTVEQTHLVHSTGPSVITVERTVLDHPIRGTLPGGDCLDLVGYSPDQIITAVVRNNNFLHCDRGGLQVHSGAYDLIVDSNVFNDTGDVDINSEGSGGSGRWTITRNKFKKSANNQGAYAIALDLVDDVVVANNTMERGMYLYSATRVAITHNVIDASSGNSAASGAVELTKASNQCQIMDNVITRRAALPAGPVVHVGPHGTEQAQDVAITRNVMHQETTNDVIFLEGTANISMFDNTISYEGGTSTSVAGLRLLGSGGASGTMTSYISLIHNTFNGALAQAILTGGANGRQNIGSLLAAWNTASVKGLQCVNLSGITGPIMLVYNQWLASSCGVPSIAVTIP